MSTNKMELELIAEAEVRNPDGSPSTFTMPEQDDDN